jgi:hypothetical protein
MMNKFLGIAVIAFSMTMLYCCNDVNGADATLFHESEIDTTLHIEVMQEGSLTIFTVDKYMTTIVKIPSISSYIYSQRPTKSLHQIAIDSGYAIVVNSSFFDGLYDDPAAHTCIHYKHAGYLRIGDTTYEPIKDDRQLSRLFAYDRKKNIVDYFGVNDLAKTNDYDLVVQIGPQIIAKNEIDTVSINASINGNRKASRTTFASVDGKEFYLIITLDLVTLAELGAMLKSTGIFKKELNVIDFDGGPSTRVYIRNHPKLTWMAEYPWPLLIGVK